MNNLACVNCLIEASVYSIVARSHCSPHHPCMVLLHEHAEIRAHDHGLSHDLLAYTFHVPMGPAAGILLSALPQGLDAWAAWISKFRAARASRAAFRPRAMAGSGWPWPDGRTAMASGHHLPTSNYGAAKLHATARIKGRTRCPLPQYPDRRPFYLRPLQTSLQHKAHTPPPLVSLP